MRRTGKILLLLLMIFLIATPVFGANNASRITVVANINPDESAVVTVTANLHIEENDGTLQFPIPGSATGISVNGSSRIGVTRSGDIKYLKLADVVQNMTGDFTMTIQYTLPDVIASGSADLVELQLPLLSGFTSPVSQLDFTVTLPGACQAKPGFSSGYHQANIEKDLSYTVQGNTVTGYSLTELKDHETLTMTLPVEESLFPNAPLVFFESDADDTAMWICMILALVYWLVFLRCLPPKRQHSTMPPEGVSAGQLGAVLTLSRSDLSLMAFSWAQLGYLQIRVQKGGRVLLQKKMDMGNERSSFEVRCFHGLFGKRDTVDTSSLSYAAYSKKVAKMKAGLQFYVLPRSGNPKLFRAISAAASLFAGVSFGIAMSQGAALQGFWVFIVAVLGLLCGWYMQQTVAELFLIKSRTTYGGLIASAGYLVLGLLSGQLVVAVVTLLFQWLAGAMACYGGRRTSEGKQDFARVLGLRRYLSSVSKEELRRICQTDPEYFYALAPYALALGVDKSFARRFGSEPLPECPYIDLGKDARCSAAQWSTHLRQILSDMKRRSRMLPLEKLMGLFSSGKK